MNPPAEWPTIRTGAPEETSRDSRIADESAAAERVAMGPVPRARAMIQSGVHTSAIATPAAPRAISRRASSRYIGGAVRNPPRIRTVGRRG